jgi:hypothetical protein
VHNEKNQIWFDSSNRYPPFFITAALIGMSDRVRIIKNDRRSLESDLVFPAIDSTLALIPLKSHGRAIIG